VDANNRWLETTDGWCVDVDNCKFVPNPDAVCAAAARAASTRSRRVTSCRVPYVALVEMIAEDMNTVTVAVQSSWRLKIAMVVSESLCVGAAVLGSWCYTVTVALARAERQHAREIIRRRVMAQRRTNTDTRTGADTGRRIMQRCSHSHSPGDSHGHNNSAD
jgi:hypothetical protein